MAKDDKRITRQQVQSILGVDVDFLRELEREEIIVCDDGGCYAVAVVERIRICQSLHHDLGVNFPGLEVALNLLDTIHGERRQFHEALRWLIKENESEE